MCRGASEDATALTILASPVWRACLRGCCGLLTDVRGALAPLGGLALQLVHGGLVVVVQRRCEHQEGDVADDPDGQTEGVGRVGDQLVDEARDAQAEDDDHDVDHRDDGPDDGLEPAGPCLVVGGLGHPLASVGLEPAVGQGPAVQGGDVKRRSHVRCSLGK